MVRESEDKAERILSIYSQLKEGKIIYKMKESEEYGVAPRTIQRDISDIQCFLQNQNVEMGEVQEIVYDKKVGGYRLETKVQNHLQMKEVLAISKVLLESRSLVKQELFPIIHKIINTCNGEDRQMLKEMVANEMHHYVELRHGKCLVDSLWELENAIKDQRYISIHYRKLKDKELVERKIKPVGIMFSEFYFYLTAYIEDIDKGKEFRNQEDIYPTIYRVDRLENIKILDENFSMPYSKRFEEGEFRKRIQFMYGGKMEKVRFDYSGISIEAILDRLPTAEIVKESEEGGIYTIIAEVFGKGIEMWIRSQGDYVSNVQYF